ncbi:MAG: DUF3656 domain-containing protein [Lachnospiraceae bacterium]|nr:DUF3656 domain-containing protein [Lachnospiraceae bacterium]
MCTIKILPEIIESGVYSLKIEGRMKSPEYTAGVVSIYRKYVDLLKKNGPKKYHVEDKDYKKLEQIYSRSGFNEGYYKQHNGKNMMTFKKPSYSGQNEELIKEINSRFVALDKKLKLDGYIRIAEDEPIILTISFEDKYVTLYGTQPLEALKQPITEENVIKQISKTGNTPYIFGSLTVDISGNVFVPVKELNELRRKAIDSLTEELLSGYRRIIEPVKMDSSIDNISKNEIFKINCLVSNYEQFKICAENKYIDNIYISLDTMDVSEAMVEMCHNKNKKILLALPYIFRKEAKSYFKDKIEYINSLGIDGLLIRNVDEIHFAKTNFVGIPMIFDYYLYSMNDEAVRSNLKLGAIGYTESVELNFKELKDKEVSCGEIIVYGYIPLMVTAGCINKNLSKCTRTNEKYLLIDRYKTEFKVKNICRFCYNLIYNSLPISLLSVDSEVKRVLPSSIRLQFVDETAREAEEIIDKYVKTFIYNEQVGEIEPSTRGHFKRGIE